MTLETLEEALERIEKEMAEMHRTMTLGEIIDSETAISTIGYILNNFVDESHRLLAYSVIARWAENYEKEIAQEKVKATGVVVSALEDAGTKAEEKGVSSPLEDGL